MEYAEFEKKFLSELNNKNKECLNTIENNEKLVQLYLQNTEKPIHINNIVNNINDIILKEKEDFALIKKVLFHPLMKDVLENFRNSDVLIKACKQNNLKAQNWLLDMRIRNNIDENGKTVPMYLLEQGNYEDFNKFIVKRYRGVDDIEFDINHHSKITNECIVSILIKKYKEMFTHNNRIELLKNSNLYNISYLANALCNVVTYPGCDFNIAIDEEGNTPLMFFIMMEDYPTVSFLISHYPDIDFSKKNVHGINASFLSLLIKNENSLMDAIVNHKTFDHEILDKHQNNLLIYSILYDNPFAFSKLLIKNEKVIDHVNDNKENVIIIATKLGFLDKINSYNLRNANFNQQDYLGNTALFYAIKLKNEYAINLLAYYGADANIKNNQGVSPLDQAKEMNEKNILKILKKPVPIHKMKSKLKGKSQGLSFFNKEKKSDEKIEKYIKNYQINNYYKDYQDLIENINITYENKNRIEDIEQILAVVYYETVNNNDNYIPLNFCDARTILDNELMQSIRYGLVSNLVKYGPISIYR